jgi:serine/threonine-protein kinase RsbT
METEFENALAMLVRHISPVNARQLLVRALKEVGVTPERAVRGDIARCHSALRRGIELFVDLSKRGQAFTQIDAYCGVNGAAPKACTMNIAVEQDIGRARSETRRICDAIGANPFSVQKVATIVSELARNMVLYASGGVVEILLVESEGRRIVVKATDYGAGIPNLDEIMSGRYKSRTGMGRGLLGTKRLSDRFSISSDHTGTRVVAEVNV